MAAFTVPAAELARIVRAVEKSAARDDSRPVLAGLHVTLTDDALTIAAADGFRLSTAQTTLDAADAGNVSPATLERAPLLAFVKALKPKASPSVVVSTSDAAWTFTTNAGTATVQTIPGAYPALHHLLGTGDEPVLFTINPRYLADVLSVSGANYVTVSRAKDDATAPLFFATEDGTRHIVMPMVLESAPERQPEQPESSPVTPDESAFRTSRAARERRDARRAERAAASAAISCPECGDAITAHDQFCGACGACLMPATEAETNTLDGYSTANQRRILDQCPHATDVRGFTAWRTAGRTVRRGEKGIRIHAPVTDGEKVVAIKPTHVFDVSQTDELPAKAAA